jgi:hypothetical protein
MRVRRSQLAPLLPYAIALSNGMGVPWGVAGMGLFWTNVGILAGFTILYRGLAFAALHRRVTKK